jgi:hypothetical protein
MVFKHLPSSLFLMAVPLAPSGKWAIALFFAREALVARQHGQKLGVEIVGGTIKPFSREIL